MNTAEEKKTRKRLETCTVCGASISRRKSVVFPDIGRICRVHYVCCVCGKLIEHTEAVILKRPQDLAGALIVACPHHPGIQAPAAEGAAE